MPSLAAPLPTATTSSRLPLVSLALVIASLALSFAGEPFRLFLHGLFPMDGSFWGPLLAHAAVNYAATLF
jgi:hypothetical protein